jgi:hypothetical protein
MHSEDPSELDVAQAPGKQEEAEGDEHNKVDSKRHEVTAVKRSMEDVRAVGERERVGEGPDETRQVIDRGKKPANENHGEEEEVGECLSSELQRPFMESL